MSTAEPRITWRKSARSGNGEACIEVAVTAGRHKSTYSGDNGDCVEVAVRARRVLVRDSKDPEGPRLVLSEAGWRGLVRAVGGGGRRAG